MRRPCGQHAYPCTVMYLNLVQIAESFGVSEKVIEDWIRREELPHIPERGRVLFDRAQVANWAAARGLAAQAGFLAPVDPALSSSWRLEALLRQGGIWRNVAAAEVIPTLARVVEAIPAAPAVRQLIAQRIRAPGGINLAPVGGGVALPHPTARVALGRDSGTVALLLLREAYVSADGAPDDIPLTCLLFFVAPSPRAHLDLLGRMSRLLSRGPLRESLAANATDEELFAIFRASDNAGAAPEREVSRS